MFILLLMLYSISLSHWSVRYVILYTNLCILATLFTARRHASAIYVIVVCLSVCHKSGATENARTENARRSEMQGRKLRDWKMRHQYTGVEKRDSRVRKACLRIKAPKLMLDCKNEISLSVFDTFTSNSCSALFGVYLRVFGVSTFCCLYRPSTLNFSGRSCLK